MDIAAVEFSAPFAAGEVEKDIEVLFRAGPYDFAPEQGGPFVMTPDDLRRAVEAWPAAGVPITNEHNARCVFKGKLGKVHSPKAPADFATFGAKARLRRPVLDLLGPGPIKFSVNFDRRTKTVKDVSLTDHPRIEDAVAFSRDLEAAFSAEAEAAFAAYTPHGRGTLQGMHDLAARAGAKCKAPAADAGFTAPDEHSAIQKAHDACVAGGARCDLMDDTGKTESDALSAAYAARFSAPPSPREKALADELAALRAERDAALARVKAAADAAEREKADAAFSAREKELTREAETFVAGAEFAARLLPYERPLEAARVRQAARDEAKEPAEACFSEGGKEVKLGRLALAKRAVLAREPHHKTEEQLKAGDAPFAGLRLVPAGGVPPDEDAERQADLEAQRDRGLAATPAGRAVLAERERARSNGTN
jgi:hypothetical protein